ncbi:glutamate 5-kinase [Lactobacillus sp. CBA3606]|uniref:glutamate 5-kinase n=1 Tax=Lactobacillus sp. CBA3606 TaxID=2099789 RepID=UPI000CFBBB31|nr:glutamate 5-kinase [Lactobacillus sp. CBA3606]AVK64094.1 glutamate 5-kinase [Lactobacillus sp. CBA3606]
MSDKRKIRANRVVIKVGTSTLVYPDGAINLRAIDQLAFVISAMQHRGREVVLVSSGAIGVGLNYMGLTKRPTAIPEQQAIAAIGQTELIAIYKERFAIYEQKIGQLLLTRDIFVYPTSHHNVLNTFEALLAEKVVPIVNENDTVAVDELDHETKFGDNDQLSAIVATNIGADLLIMLSDIDGFYDGNPKDPTTNLIPHIAQVDDRIYALAGGSGSRFGTGGMVTKLKAAERMIAADGQMILANGADPTVIFDLLDGEPLGTLFGR